METIRDLPDNPHDDPPGLTLVSDGTPLGTYLLGPQGQPLGGVTMLNYTINSEYPFSECTIHLWGVPAIITKTLGDDITVIGDQDQPQDLPGEADNLVDLDFYRDDQNE